MPQTKSDTSSSTCCRHSERAKPDDATRQHVHADEPASCCTDVRTDQKQAPARILSTEAMRDSKCGCR